MKSMKRELMLAACALLATPLLFNKFFSVMVMVAAVLCLVTFLTIKILHCQKRSELTKFLRSCLAVLCAVSILFSASPMAFAAETTSQIDHLREEIADYIEENKLSHEMTDEELLNAYTSLDGWSAYNAWITAESILEEARLLPVEEQEILASEANTVLAVRFYDMILKLNNPVLLAATTIDGVPGLSISVANDSNAALKDGQIAVSTTGYENCGDKSNSDTITIDCTEDAATVSFNWSYTVSGGSGAAVTINGEAVSKTSGTVSLLLVGDQTITIGLTSPAGKNNKLTFTMSNFSVEKKTDATEVTFNYDNGLGTVKVAGTTVAPNGKADIPATGATLTAAPASGASFLGWVNAATDELISTAAEYALTTVDPMTIHAVFSKGTPWYLADNKYLYSDWGKACTKAAAGNKVIVLACNATLPAGDFTIPAGITFLIPYNSANTLNTTTPSTYGESTKQPTKYRELTLASGANVIVNGAISLSAAVRIGKASQLSGGPCGPCSFIKMSSGSNITVNSGGTLYAWGYVYGSGTVTAKSGSNVYECFQFMDFRGGTQTTGMKNEVFPFSQYYVQNVEVPMTIEAGAKLSAATCFTVSIIGTQQPVVAFVSNKDAFFTLTSGTAVKRYDSATDRLVIEVDGTASLSPISMRVSGVNIKSSDYIMPLNGNVTLDIKSGSNVTISQDLALLPGAEVIIRENATCTLGNGTRAFVYDAEQWGTYCSSSDKKFMAVYYSPSRAYTRTESDLKDAIIQVDGKIDASKGYLYTTAGGANICSTGTGEVLVTPGTETVTYQLRQTASTYDPIPITTAKFKNADGTYKETTETANYVYEDGFWVVKKCETCTPDANNPATCTTPQLCTVCGSVCVPALEHAFGETTYAPTKEAFNLETDTVCTATRACTRSGCGYTETAEAPITQEEFAATCKEKAHILCSANFTVTWAETQEYGKHVFEDSELAPHTIPGQEHYLDYKEPTCAEEGYIDYHCYFCDTDQREILPKSDIHNPSTEYSSNADFHWNACICGMEFNRQGHIPGAEATCTDDQVCTECGWVMKAATGHTPGAPVRENEKAATCYGEGSYEEVVYCSVEGCKAVLSRETKTIDKIAHTFGETVPYKAATCLAPGNEAYKQCEICKQYFAAAAEANATDGATDTTGFAIPEKQHSYTGAIKSDGNGKEQTHSRLCVNGCNEYGDPVAHNWNAGEQTTAPGCETDGVKTYTCTDGCGATYTETVAATGHTYSDAWAWNADGTYTLTLTCGNCAAGTKDHVLTKTGTGTETEKTDATCANNGSVKYTASVTEGTQTFTSTSDAFTLTATGAHTGGTATCTAQAVCSVCSQPYGTTNDNHAWSVTYNFADDGSACTATHVCGNDASHNVTVNATITSEVIKAPTCTDKGTTKYTATFEETWAETQTKQVEVAALGHKLTQTATAKDATCTEAGNIAYWTCGTCGKFFSDAEGKTEIAEGKWVINALGHTAAEAVVEKEVAATCTADGSYDTVVYCSVCDAELSRKTTTVPATGHAYGDEYVTENGSHYKVCANGCGIPGDAGTCSDNTGDENHQCDVCGAENVTAHDWAPATFEAPETCRECGMTQGAALVALAQIKKADGSIVKYVSFNDALQAAIEGDTIVLLADAVSSSGFYPIVLPANGTLDLNRKTFTGTAAGRIAMNGGTLKTYADDGVTIYTMAGPTIEGEETPKYITTDAVFVLGTDWSMTVESGTAELGEPWRTMPNQKVTIGKDAVVSIPEGMTFTILGEVIVEGTLTCDGTIELGYVNASLTIADEDLDVTLAEGQNLGDCVLYVDGKYVIHTHTPGAEATCTTAQICTVCEEVLVPALDHAWGEAQQYEATEEFDAWYGQLCTRCSEKNITTQTGGTQLNTVTVLDAEGNVIVEACSLNEAFANYNKKEYTFKLLKSTTGSGLLKTTTLDLNGFTLTVDDHLVVFSGSHVIDTNADNLGRLAVLAGLEDMLLLPSNNKQLPVKTETGYMFAEIVAYRGGFDGNAFAFQPRFETAAFTALKAGKANSGVHVIARVSWGAGDTLRKQDFEFSDTMMNGFINGYNGTSYKKMFTLTLSLEDWEPYTFEIVVTSDLGVELHSDDTYNRE